MRARIGGDALELVKKYANKFRSEVDKERKTTTAIFLDQHKNPLTKVALAYYRRRHAIKIGLWERARACLNARNVELKNMKEGRLVAEIYKATKKALNNAGYNKFISRFGHGLGLDYMEQPEIWETTMTRLKNNMVMEVHPGAFVPGIGAAYIGDPYLITNKRVERLSTCNTELMIV